MAAPGRSSLALLALALAGCGTPDIDEDMYAIGACNRAVEERAPGQELRSTVRDEGPDRWVVSVWADEPAEGTPDFSCGVVRDADAEEGLRVDSLRP